MRTTETSAIARTAGGLNTTPLILVLFTVSGATGLMLEVVWSRMLVGLLGSTTWGILTVLVVYMGGLGLGSILWGRHAARSERPLRLYGGLELGIGLFTLSVPWLFSGVGALYVLATRAAGETSVAGAVVRVAAAALALVIPTTLMGGTLPVLTQVVAREWDRPGRAAGALYAANTFGAVVGCFLTGFALLLWLGLSTTNALAAGLDLVIGLMVLLWDRRSPPLSVETTSAAAGPTAPTVSGSAALAVATFSGFCGLAYEVLWTRGILATLTESTTYAFTMMLTVFLAGHALGSALGNRRWGAPLNAAGEAARTWRRLGLAQAFAGLTALVSLPLLVAAQGPLDWVLITARSTFWSMVVPFELGVCMTVLFVPAAFLGASFPLAARLYVGRGRTVAGSTGRLYGMNTAGAIVGASATAGLLVPWLGTQRVLALLAAAQAVQGGLAYVLCGGPGRLGRVSGALLISLLVGGAVALNAGLTLMSIYAHKEPGRMLAAAEGAGATVTVHQRATNDRVININSVNVAGTNRVLRTTQKLQAHLPLLLHPAPRSVLQIGFGAGGTCHSVRLHREIESIEVAELSPEVLAMARRWFADVNHAVLEDPRVKVRIVDARSHMAVTDQSYDVILSDSIHPRFRGNATLYTRDYFALCARRLRPGGLVSTWLPLYGMAVDDLRSVLKSLQAVFPHVQVWYPNAETNENTIVIGSMTPIAVDWPRVVATLADPAISADLAEVDIRGPYQLLDFFLTGERGVAAFAQTGRLNTDDHPTLEFLAPRTLHRQLAWLANLRALCGVRESIVPRVTGASPEVRAELDRWHAATTWKLAAQVHELEGDITAAIGDYTECVRINSGDHEAAKRLKSLQLLKPMPSSP